LLITAEPVERTNFALAANGATASASSTYSGYPLTADQTINGDRKGVNWPNSGGWHSSSTTFPQWLQVDFNGIGELPAVESAAPRMVGRSGVHSPQLQLPSTRGTTSRPLMLLKKYFPCLLLESYLVFEG
jgi:hypothetical protein